MDPDALVYHFKIAADKDGGLDNVRAIGDRYSFRNQPRKKYVPAPETTPEERKEFAQSLRDKLKPALEVDTKLARTLDDYATWDRLRTFTPPIGEFLTKKHFRDVGFHPPTALPRRFPDKETVRLAKSAIRNRIHKLMNEAKHWRWRVIADDLYEYEKFRWVERTEQIEQLRYFFDNIMERCKQDNSWCVLEATPAWEDSV